MFALSVLFRFPVAVAIVGGNCDNGAQCGRYLNVNNVAGNARWNIGASLCLSLLYGITARAVYIFHNANIFP